MQCPGCNRQNTSGSAYCRFCGHRLDARGERPTPAAPPPAKRTKAPPPAKTPPATKSKTSARGKRRVRWGRLIASVFGGLVVLGLVGAGVVVANAVRTLPPVQNLVAAGNLTQNSVVYDINGKPIATLHGTVNRQPVPIGQVAPVMQHALVAIEDHSFYTNPGFDIRSILRATVVDLVHHTAVQGASTITEQLAKDLYLSDKKSLTRKVQEFIIGLELARLYSKPQILDMYLNEVYFGNGASGIYAASESYFGVPPSQLTLPEASLLAGLPQAPSLYDPLVNLKYAKARQQQVLQAMARYGYISQSEATQAYNAPLDFTHGKIKNPSSTSLPYPWFVSQVIKQLETQYHISSNEVYNGGLKIYTTLNPTVYNAAQNAVDHWMNVNFGQKLPAQAAEVVEDPKTGYILAEIGGRSGTWRPDGYDYAMDPERSTGSSIKPLLDYAPAIAKGYTQMSVIQDVPIFKHNGKPWPSNDDHIYRGYLTLRDALGISDNDVAVKLLNDIGLQYGVNFATSKFGVPISQQEVNQQQLSLAIGAYLNAYQMTQAYATFANAGVRMTPIWISKVVDNYGAVVVQNTPHGTPVLTPQQAYIMDQMLGRVLTPTPLPGFGPGGGSNYTTGSRLGIGRPAGGKTGTNNGEADAWFIGFTPQLVAGVWEGNPNSETPQPYTISGAGPAYGATAAGPIWQTTMEQVDAALHLPVENFPRPNNLVYVPNVSITSGLLAGPHTPASQIEGAWFIQGTQPTQFGATHVQVAVTQANPNLLWQPGCGPSITSVFLKPESDWKTGIPLPWDSRYWPPTKTCTPGNNPPSSSSSGATQGPTPPAGGSPGSTAGPSSTSSGPTAPSSSTSSPTPGPGGPQPTTSGPPGATTPPPSGATPSG